MEMIRWLLSNRIVQVAWGLGVLAVLLAWIFGGSKAGHEAAEVDAPAKVEQVAQTAVATTDAATTAVTETKEEVTEVAAETKAAVAAGATAVAATAVATTQALADTAEATTEAVTETVVAEVETVKTEAVADAEQVVSGTEKAEVAEVVTQAEEAVTEVAEEASDAKDVAAEVSEEAVVTTSADGLAEKSSEDLLMMAREAYWNNGLEEAAEIYTALIEREPNVIEHKGELGNVFWRQGFPKKAAELYADIAEPMIEKGNGERVSNMVGFIGLFFPERAANIRQLLEK